MLESIYRYVCAGRLSIFYTIGIFLLCTPLLGVSAFARNPRLIPYPNQMTGNDYAVVLVHGINGNFRQMKPLARELSARGYSPYLFEYRDTQALDKSASQLLRAIDALPAYKRLAVIGHSMGGLVARRALIHADQLAGTDPIEFLSLASPFGGYSSARATQNPIVRFFAYPFGVRRAHADLYSGSDFIQNPGTLPARVRHVKLESRERDFRHDRVANCENQENQFVDAEAVHIEGITAGHMALIYKAGRISAELSQRLEGLGFPDLRSGVLSVEQPSISRCRDE